MSYPVQNSRSLSRSISKREQAAAERAEAQMYQQNDLAVSQIEAIGDQLAARVRARGRAARTALIQIGLVTSLEVSLAEMFPHAVHRFQSQAELFSVAVGEDITGGVRPR